MGLRQGDPLSPFLFFICAEGLSGLIRKATRERSLHGASAVRQRPKISHLFFANDSLIFCKAKIEDCSKLADILKCYEKASGQMINLDKSGIMFNSNTCNGDREVAMNIVNIHRILEN